jgi:hypothetical protein
MFFTVEQALGCFSQLSKVQVVTFCCADQVERFYLQKFSEVKSESGSLSKMMDAKVHRPEVSFQITSQPVEPRNIAHRARLRSARA